MNCANHLDREATAFCQNCGKPLCTECTRPVGSAIFCEPCLAARVVGYQPVAGYASVVPPVGASGGPNPGLAALLGFIPGVGAMYNEQYGKGIVHLVVFAILVSLSDHLDGIFSLLVAGWIFYMVIEAHHTARARRDGTPLPNPFGLNDVSERLGFGSAWSPNSSGATGTVPDPAQPVGSAAYAAAEPVAPFVAPSAAAGTPPYPAAGVPPYTYVPPVPLWGAPQETYSTPYVAPVPPYIDPAAYARRFPAGAIWLIGLGTLFLFGNIGFFHFIQARLFGPLLLIGVSVWVFFRRMTGTGHGLENDGTPMYHWRFLCALRSAMWVFLSGILWLLDSLDIVSWSRSWPVFLIAGGVLMFLRRSNYPSYGAGYPAPGYAAQPPAAPMPESTSLVPRPDETGTPEGR